MQRETPHYAPGNRGGFSEHRPVSFPGRIFRLSADRRSDGSVRFLSGLSVTLSEGATQSWVTVTRTGTFFDPRWGEFEITPRMLAQMVENFDAGAFGQDVFVDVEHDRKPGAAGRFVRLAVEGNRLRALVEWTKFGIEAIQDRGFRYLSAEFHERFVDNETRAEHGVVLMGAGLTTRPVIKRLDPVQLSQEFTPPQARVLLHPQLVRQLSESARNYHMNWFDALRKKLSALGLAENVVKQLCESAKAAAQHLGEDEKALAQLATQFEATGKALASSVGDREISLSINLPKAPDGKAADPDAPKALSEEAVAKIVAKQLADAQAAAEAQQKKLAEDLDGRRRLLAETIDEAKGLDDAAKAEMKKELGELVGANMTDDQIKALAAFQITQANKTAADRQLAGLGYRDSRSGSPHITIDDANNAKRLSECIRENLGKTSVAQFGGLRLPKEDNPFVARVLAEFDRRNAHRIDHERKVLAGEVSVDSNTDLPVGFQREVIREALSDLNVLALLQQLTDFNSTTVFDIPYEERDVSGIVNDGIVYEGQGIPSAGIDQKMDPAYVQKMALAMRLTNEVMHFTRASAVNWDAWARNAESNTRAIRELLQRRVANNLMRSSDAFESAEVTGESIATQLGGATSTIKTAEFPIVRPLQVRDISGDAIGNVENPIAVDFDGTNIPEWDGTGTQAAGTYFRVADYNLGYVQFVDKDGDPVTPDEATATISYSRVTNIVKFDLDFDAAETTLSAHLDGVLRAVGNRKAALNGKRQVMPDFALLSPTLADMVTNAKGFVPLTGRPGAAANDATGDLERVKGLPMFETNAPQLDMGDARIVIGQRGVGAYGISKPWTIGQPFEAVNAQGLPTGKKVAYGEEYNVVHVPRPVRYRFSSVLVYSAGDR